MSTQLFDFDQAVEILQAFNKVSGLGGTLFEPCADDGRVNILYTLSACKGRCQRCISSEEGGTDLWIPSCQKIHHSAAHFADRFGGRYFYLCDEDRIFFAAPIIADGGLMAALTIGPVHIFDIEENNVKRSDLKPFPVRAPSYVQHLSTLLSACAVSVSDSSQTNLRAVKQASLEQQSKIHKIISKNKGTRFIEYPIAYEEDLVAAIESADSATARIKLNDTLGMLLSSSYVGANCTLMQRCEELVTLCSRAALRAGVSTDAVFDASQLYRNELARLRTNEQLCNCLQRYVEHLVFLVTRLREVGYEDDIYRAIEYIRYHYNENLTLEKTAREIGFSPSYFSRVFKKKTGCNFNEYVNRVRIDASKSGLLSTDLSLAEIAKMSGYEDAAYFSRVFKRVVGITPGYYRSHRGQVDRGKERMASQ